MPASQEVDYSLYLVTDSTSTVLGDKDLVAVVEGACKGGTTIVQYRDKSSDTGHLIETARRLHAVTKKYKVPLLINDRIDVALTVGCEGVHIGQDDIDFKSARQILGRDAIIGVTVSCIEEAQKACNDGADYLGIGTVYSTQTQVMSSGAQEVDTNIACSKIDTKSIIGTAGTKAILESIADRFPQVKTVCIGGINSSNVQRVLFQTGNDTKELDGVAIVSAIIAAPSSEEAARHLCKLFKTPPPFAVTAQASKSSEIEKLLLTVPEIIRAVYEKAPLSHNMTNLVVQNFAANVALSIGASPIMANYGDEAIDLCELGGALVVNMGTVTPDGLLQYTKAIQAYNSSGGPIVFDPVGAGATAIRRSAVKALMAAGYFSLIKGNENEIRTVHGEAGVVQRGVDSGVSTLDARGKVDLVRALACRERGIVLMTGVIDYVSDGRHTFAVSNGHELLGEITGSGCVLGTIISAMMAVEKEDRLAAAVAGLLHYEIAAEIAAARQDVNGPGTFVPALIDELYRIRQQTSKGDLAWLERAKVEVVDVQ